MRLADRFRLSWGQTRRGGVRSLLCAGTVAVGVLAMSVIGAVGQYARGEMTEAVRSVGLRGMTCFLVEQQTGDALTPAFAEAVEQGVPGVDAAMPVKYLAGRYQTGHKSGNAVLFGVDERMRETLDVTLLDGRLFTAGESTQPVRRAVISERLARSVFGRVAVCGQSIRLTVDGAENRYEIVGVIRDQAGLLTGLAGSGVPEIIYLPYGLLAQRSDTADQVLLAYSGDTKQLEQRLNQIAAGLLGLRGSVGVQNLSGYLDEIDQMATGAVRIFLLVAAVSLVVALVAVTCGMLSAAHEMREEIGIYRAVGGRRRDIFWIFLIQSGLICLIGAAAGLAAAWGGVGLVRLVTGRALFVPAGLSLVCLGLSVLCGALAGIAPALRAANLDPVQTMHR